MSPGTESEPDEQRRKCYRCGELKPTSAFSWRRKQKGQRDSFCKPCRSAYGKKHYEANKQRYIDQAERSKRKLRLERTRFLIEYFTTHPCVDCGETDPLVLEFDHLGDKEFTVGQALTTYKWESILAEMAKCEVTCANCHRRRTVRRKGTFRTLLLEKSTGN